MPAAVGSAFDCFVKHALAQSMGLQDDPRFNINTLIEDNVNADVREPAVKLGRMFFDVYVKRGRLDRLIHAGIADIELAKKVTLTDGIHEVPIYGKLDAITSGGYPIDWKVQGATSNSGASPTPGYVSGVNARGTMVPHKRVGEPLDKLNEQWALQMTIYYWMYNGLRFDAQAVIENVTTRSGKLACTTIETYITEEYQRNLWSRMVDAWKNICDGTHLPAAVHKRRCNAYNTLCECASLCGAYQRWEKGEQTDEEILEMLRG